MHASKRYSGEYLENHYCFLSTPIPNPSAVFKEDRDGWGVLVNLDTASAMALNPTRSAVWKLIDGRQRTEDGPRRDLGHHLDAQGPRKALHYGRRQSSLGRVLPRPGQSWPGSKTASPVPEAKGSQLRDGLQAEPQADAWKEGHRPV